MLLPPCQGRLRAGKEKQTQTGSPCSSLGLLWWSKISATGWVSQLPPSPPLAGLSCGEGGVRWRSRPDSEPCCSDHGGTDRQGRGAVVTRNRPGFLRRQAAPGLIVTCDELPTHAGSALSPHLCSASCSPQFSSVLECSWDSGQRLKAVRCPPINRCPRALIATRQPAPAQEMVSQAERAVSTLEIKDRVWLGGSLSPFLEQWLSRSLTRL